MWRHAESHVAGSRVTVVDHITFIDGELIESAELARHRFLNPARLRKKMDARLDIRAMWSRGFCVSLMGR